MSVKGTPRRCLTTQTSCLTGRIHKAVGPLWPKGAASSVTRSLTRCTPIKPRRFGSNLDHTACSGLQIIKLEAALALLTHGNASWTMLACIHQTWRLMCTWQLAMYIDKGRRSSS